MKQKIITVFGGSGFLGRHLIPLLAAQGAVIRVAVRHPEAATFLKPMGEVGQIKLIYAPLEHQALMRAAIQGADDVINLVGILYPKGPYSFEKVHSLYPYELARACKEAKIERLVHVSALGAQGNSLSQYGRSKAQGEQNVIKTFPKATIVRPSILFGAEDTFTNRFGRIAVFSPFLPLIGGGKTHLQPAFVGDVAQAIVNILEDKKTQSKVFELGGARIYSWRDIMALILKETGRKAWLLPLSWTISKALGFIGQMLPTPPLTVDQVILMGMDHVVASEALGFKTLGIDPICLEVVLPTYFSLYRKRGV